jgi:hypothetical protein
VRELGIHLGVGWVAFLKKIRSELREWASEGGLNIWGDYFDFRFFFIAHNRRALSSSCLHLVFGGYSYFWRFDFGDDSGFFRLRSTGHCFAPSFSLQNMMMQMDAIDDVFLEKTGQFCFLSFLFFAAETVEFEKINGS